MINLKFLDKSPEVHPSVYIVDTARIIGDVRIDEDSSVWFNTVIRGDVNYIRIGKRTNIQDGCVLHVTRDTYPLIMEDDITVGHGVVLHGCKIGPRCIVCMGAVVLDGVEIGQECIIAAGAVVTEKKKIPPRTLVAGVPAIPRRAVTEKDIEWIMRSSQNYVNYKNVYKKRSI